MENNTESKNSNVAGRKGRPVGSVIFDRDSFWEYSIKMYVKHWCDTGAHPSQDDVACRLGIVRSTMSRYLKNYEISWRQIRREAVKVDCEQDKLWSKKLSFIETR
jgi:hypothetical protein